MFGLSHNLKTRLAFYKSKMPTHGATLAAVVHNYANPAYCSHGPCPSFASAEDIKAGQPAKGWYGFPIKGSMRNYKPESFGTVYGLRCIGAGDKCGDYSNRDAQGYYCDSFCHETIYPLVFRLNSGRGFLAGHYLSDSGEVYISKDIYPCERSAFNGAHSRAERYAESCREDNAKFQAECQIDSLREDNPTTREYLRNLIKELRTACDKLADSPAIRLALESSVRESLIDLQSNRKRIAALTDNYWLSVAE